MNVNFILPAKSLVVSRSGSLPPRLISSPSMLLHSLPCQSSSPVRNRPSDKIIGEITWCACVSLEETEAIPKEPVAMIGLSSEVHTDLQNNVWELLQLIVPEW